MVLALAGLICQFSDLNRAGFLLLHQLAEPYAKPASALSVVGLGASGLTAFALIGLRRRWLAAATVLILLLGGLLIQSIKTFFDLPRPLSVLGPEKVRIIGNVLHARAMPSGHAAMLTALATLAWIGPGRLKAAKAPHPHALLLALASIAVAGALSRVIVGAHWPADVLIGAALGVLAGGIALDTTPGTAVVQQTSTWLESPRGSRSMAISLILAAATLWHSRDAHPLANELSLMIAGATITAAMLWWAEGAPTDGGRT